MTLFAPIWMDPEIIILSEVSQTEKDKYYMISLIGGTKKNYINELISKTEIDSNIKNELMVTKGERRVGRAEFEVWD